MKNIKVLAIALALVFGLAASIFAVSNFSNLTAASAAKSTKSSCCAGGNDESCPLKNKQQAAQTVSRNGIIVENAGSDCQGGQTAKTGDKDCCGAGADCCNGGACCQGKHKTTAKL